MKSSLIALTGFIIGIAIPASGQGIVVSAVASANPSSVSAPPFRTDLRLLDRHDRYQLRKGDSFDLDFAISPEYNQTVAVQPDGYVTFKGAGSVFVEGQTIPELTETVKEAYAKILHDPIITVDLKDFEKPYFIAAGQVGKPGKYDLRGPITVTEGVAIAGGFNEKAKHSQVVLFHPTTDGIFEAKLLNVKKLLASRNLSEDIYLQPGDMLYVPQNAYSKFERYLPSANMGAYVSPTAF